MEFILGLQAIMSGLPEAHVFPVILTVVSVTTMKFPKRDFSYFSSKCFSSWYQEPHRLLRRG